MSYFQKVHPISDKCYLPQTVLLPQSVKTGPLERESTAVSHWSKLDEDIFSSGIHHHISIESSCYGLSDGVYSICVFEALWVF